MPSTVERPIPANVVAHATEYPPDRDRRERQEHEKRKGSESAAAQRPEFETPDQDEPAVVIDDHHETSHVLDGVNAYQAAAHHAREPVKAGAGHTPVEADTGPVLPQQARQAYEDHEHDETPHKVNVAT